MNILGAIKKIFWREEMDERIGQYSGGKKWMSVLGRNLYMRAF
jgi:hypothetical protein